MFHEVLFMCITDIGYAPESIMEYLNPCLRSLAVTIQDVKIDHIDGNAIVKFQNVQYNRRTLC